MPGERGDMQATQVFLASGDQFYVDASMDDVVGVLQAGGIVCVGSRYVNPSQVAQLVPLKSSQIPSILTPERIGVEHGVAV